MCSGLARGAISSPCWRVIGIVYGATVALVQKDFKFVIGYSSVSHMGFVLLGLMTLNQIGLDGAVLQMFSHGVIAGLLFAVAGRMVYDRTHTRVLSELRPMRLRHLIPFAAVTFVIACMASIGIPGFSGFIAEFEVLVGAWRAFPTLAMLAGVGILVGIAFTWRAMDKAFFGEPDHAASAHAGALPPISMAERAGAVILLASGSCGWPVSAAASGFDCSVVPLSFVRWLAPGRDAMSAVSYAELLRLTLPEIVIALTALVALTVDLSVLRKSALGDAMEGRGRDRLRRLRGRDLGAARLSRAG